ncbi:MAG TPA: 2OG-Fe(II) oxygenase [Allosphingosinicella sp.]|jgi:predicted 2-oxoglutarate/Fe(II)-dependent dioxygenase YbiX
MQPRRSASETPERDPVGLGLKLLSEGGPPGEGAALIEDAFRAGDGEAAAALATLEAMGAGRPQSWDRALDYLEIAAQRGSPSAQAQLMALARSASRDWRALREGLDIPAVTTPPARRAVSEQPRIRVIEGFATAGECDWVMSVAKDRLQPARVWDPVTGEGRADPNRTNRALELGLADMDVVLQLLRARISAASNLPLPVFEPAQVMQYRPGEEFRPHFDFLDPKQPGHGPELARFGQRIATFILYLNDDYEGGETEFPDAGFSHRGRKGDALLFANVDSARAPDPLTRHAGRPPIGGEKWIFSQWIRDRSPGPPPA